MNATTETTVTPWPVDFDALTKGTDIPAEVIEDCYGLLRYSPEYNLKKLALAKQIEERMARRGIIATVKAVGHGLRVLSDEEASEYNTTETERAIRKMGRCVKRITGVDTAGFDDKTKRMHDARVNIVGTVYLAARRARKDCIKAIACERKTPPMIAETVELT